MRLISRRTTLRNNSNATIVVRGKRNGQIIEKFNVIIPSGESKYVYYDNLSIEFNYSEACLEAFGQGDEDSKTTLLTSLVRDNEVLVFNYKSGKVICNPIKGKFSARIGLFHCFVSPSAIPQQ